MTRRRWGFPSLLADGSAREFPPPDAAPAPPTVPLAATEPDHPRPLSWDAEDAAVAAGECPWHPHCDFPDHTALLRHVVQHARGWQAEAMQSERMRRSLEGQVREFTADVAAMAAGILGETP